MALSKIKYPILFTRPTTQNQALIELIGVSNRFYEFPTIEIQPIANPEIPKSIINKTLTRLIFISSNAVSFGWPLVQSLISPTTQLVAIGVATANKLKLLSQRDVLFPSEQSDSEALVSMPTWQSLKNEQIVICRGQGGREWLKNELEVRGAEVDYLECYKRQLPSPNLSILDNAIDNHAVILIMSRESLTNLLLLAGTTRFSRLKKLDFIVTHPRIKEFAYNLGIEKIHLSDNTNQAIINTWQELNH